MPHVFGHLSVAHFLEHFPLFFHFKHVLAFIVSSQSSVQMLQVLGHFSAAHFFEHLPFSSHFWHCLAIAESSQPVNQLDYINILNSKVSPRQFILTLKKGYSKKLIWGHKIDQIRF